MEAEYFARIEGRDHRVTLCHFADRLRLQAVVTIVECVRNGWPANCRWATRTEQMNNCRRNHLLNYRGETLNVTQWARRIGMRPSVLRLRVSLGWSPQRAIEQPVRKCPPRKKSRLAIS